MWISLFWFYKERDCFLWQCRKRNALCSWMNEWMCRVCAHSHYTLQVVLPGSDVKGRVTVNVDGIQVAQRLQQSLNDIITARQRRPVQTDVPLLSSEQIRDQHGRKHTVQIHTDCSGGQGPWQEKIKQETSETTRSSLKPSSEKKKHYWEKTFLYRLCNGFSIMKS